MQLGLKGNNTTFHAGYKANARGDNHGIGLWTDDHSRGDIKDVAYLWPTETGNALIIDLDEAQKQGLAVTVTSKNMTFDLGQPSILQKEAT